tara:strand:+ start:237 stop:479 length:243 start_codon:yes stop_codon:yes gene_type:complete
VHFFFSVFFLPNGLSDWLVLFFSVGFTSAENSEESQEFSLCFTLQELDQSEIWNLESGIWKRKKKHSPKNTPPKTNQALP